MGCTNGSVSQVDVNSRNLAASKGSKGLKAPRQRRHSSPAVVYEVEFCLRDDMDIIKDNQFPGGERNVPKLKSIEESSKTNRLMQRRKSIGSDTSCDSHDTKSTCDTFSSVTSVGSITSELSEANDLNQTEPVSPW